MSDVRLGARKVRGKKAITRGWSLVAILAVLALVLLPATGVRAAPGEAVATQQASKLAFTAQPGDAVIATVVGVGGQATAIGVNATTNRVYVGLGGVSVIDGASNAVTAAVAVGGQADGIGVNSVTNRIYVGNGASKTVKVIDGASNVIIATVPVIGAYDAVAVNGATNRVYVVDLQSHAVSVIDGATNTVIATIPVGGNAQTLAVNNVTNRIYVPSTGTNTVSVIDGVSSTVIATVGVGSPPFGVGVNPTTNRIYVPLISANTVSVIDGASNAVVATIAVGDAPRGVGVNATTNRIYVANGISKNVSVIDGASDAVVATVPVGVAPFDVGVNATTNRVYVGNQNSGTVSVIDGASNAVVATVGVGDLPRGVGVNATTNRVYVANIISNTVSVIDGASNAVIASIGFVTGAAGGSVPLGLRVNATTNRVYVANRRSRTVSVIKGDEVATAGAAIAPAVQVSVQDASGNTVTTASHSITLAIGTNPGGGTLSGTVTVNAVNGVASFSNLSINKAGVGYTLVASAAGLTGTTSAGFTVTFGAATKLAFDVPPGNVTAGAAITPAVQVAVQDALGNTVTTATHSITLAIGTNPGGGTLSGTVTVNAVNGVASFSNLSINKAGVGYTLVASAAGLTGTTSAGFTVTFGAATKLAFDVPPGNTTAGAAITPAVQVHVHDAFGNHVDTATNGVTIAIGANPSGGTLSGTATVSAVNGVATFANLSINKPGVGYTLVASAAGLTGATSAAFNVAVGASAKLAFTVQPSNAGAGAAITPAVQVAVQDAAGNTITTATHSVTIAIGANPGGGTPSGTLTVNAVSGVATFANLSIDKSGAGYTLVASATGLTGATSAAFSITRSTRFNPTSVALANLGDSATITVTTAGLDAGVDGVQLNIQHSNHVAITSPACVGIFAGASVLGPNPVPGGTLTGCTLLSGDVSATTGDVMTFVVTRSGGENPLLTFGLGGASGTQFSDAGVAISPGTTNTLQITGGTTIQGTVTLQGRTATFPAGVGHGIAVVTLNPGGVTVSVSADVSFTIHNVLAGTFTLTAAASGYVSRERTNVVVAGTPVSVPAVQLRCGLVDNNIFVNINDITATVAGFGTSPTARVDAQGRFVDQNGDGFVNINDITCVVSGFGLTSPLAW